MEIKFEAIDGKFEVIYGRFEAIEGRFEAIDAKFDATDARFDSTDAKIESVYRELSGKFSILIGVMALGFTLLIGLGGYNAVSPRFAEATVRGSDVQEMPETQRKTTKPVLAPTPAPRADT